MPWPRSLFGPLQAARSAALGPLLPEENTFGGPKQKSLDPLDRRRANNGGQTCYHPSEMGTDGGNRSQHLAAFTASAGKRPPGTLCGSRLALPLGHGTSRSYHAFRLVQVGQHGLRSLTFGQRLRGACSRGLDGLHAQIGRAASVTTSSSGHACPKASTPDCLPNVQEYSCLASCLQKFTY